MHSTFDLKIFLRDIKPPFVGGELELNRARAPLFYFIESIENMFLTGVIELIDTGGFLEKLPLTGEETLRIVLEQDIRDRESGNSAHSSKTIDFEFFKIILKDATSKDSVTYRFYLIEKGGLEFFRKKYSISYKNKRVSDIIRDICLNQLKVSPSDIEIEQTMDTMDNYIIPYWNPIRTIKDLVRSANSSSGYNESGYLFYSTVGDSSRKTPIKKLVSFATLLKQAPDDTVEGRYYFKKFGINPMFINNFKEVRNPCFSYRGLLKDGISGKTFYYVDFDTDKTMSSITKQYKEFFNSSTTLGKVSYFSEIDDPNGAIEFSPHNKSMTKASLDYDFRMDLESYNKREALVEGNLERHAGQVIFVEQMSDNQGDLTNEQDSGKWLIKGITHNFIGNTYEQKLVLLKDGYTKTDIEGHERK